MGRRLGRGSAIATGPAEGLSKDDYLEVMLMDEGPVLDAMPRLREIYPHVLQGNLRALVVTGPQRTRALPNVPTLSEAGLEGIQIYGWNGFLGPARMPKEVALKLNGAINEVVKKPSVDAHLRMLGYEPYTLALADAPAFLKNSVESWARMIRATGITEE